MFRFSKAQQLEQDVVSLRNQVHDLQGLLLAKNSECDDLEQALDASKQGLDVLSQENHLLSSRISELDEENSTLRTRLKDATELLERRGIAERSMREQLSTLEISHDQKQSIYLRHLDAMRSKLDEAKQEAKEKSDKLTDAQKKALNAAHGMEAGMAQIKQLASLLTARQSVQSTTPVKSPSLFMPFSSPSSEAAPLSTSTALGSQRQQQTPSGPAIFTGQTSPGIASLTSAPSPVQPRSSLSPVDSSQGQGSKVEGQHSPGEECSSLANKVLEKSDEDTNCRSQASETREAE